MQLNKQPWIQKTNKPSAFYPSSSDNCLHTFITGDPKALSK